MKPDDPQQMEVLGPDEDVWAALQNEQEREEYEQWLERMEWQQRISQAS